MEGELYVADEPVKTAVLVDDNLMFSMMVEGSLKRCGYQVRTLSGAPDIVDRIEAAAPDLVIVNLTSTRTGGPALVSALRARPALSRLPVVGYAGHVERQFFQAGKEAGADMVVPNSALKSALPEVLAKLQKRLAGADDTDWPEEED